MRDTTAIEAALDRAEEALSLDRGLKDTGFWPAVRDVKRDDDLVARYADRIAKIDRRAFERGVILRVPASVGVPGLALKSAFGVAAVAWANSVSSVPATILFLAGFGALIVGTHSLTHWIVGQLAGMRFTHVFLGGPPPPRPGVKTDYATYLRASAVERAVMHASGAVVTKLVPFLLIPFVPQTGSHRWLVWILVAVGVIQIATDVFLSTKVSDWMKVKRELASRRR